MSNKEIRLFPKWVMKAAERVVKARKDFGGVDITIWQAIQSVLKINNAVKKAKPAQKGEMRVYITGTTDTKKN